MHDAPERNTATVERCRCSPPGRKPVAPVLGLVIAAILLSGGLWGMRLLENGTSSRAPTPAAPVDACAIFDHEHAVWTGILSRHARDGHVDYAGLKDGAGGDLDAYLRTLRSVCRRHYERWTREQKLALWINAYNAYTIRLVLDHYPIESIRSIGLAPGAAFYKSFIPMLAYPRGRLSLNDIEHEILRKQFQEPRIHFAIVCASKGCPALRSEAYRASDLDRQLDQAAHDFIRNPAKNRFDPASRTLHLSSIFKWFPEDFERDGETLADFVARYAGDPTAGVLRAGGVRIEFLDYDWSLNGR